MALVLVLTGALLAIDGLLELFYQKHDKPALWALPIALASILINEYLYHYTRKRGEKIRSDLLVANAWHHRSDALASLVVTFGIAGTLLGFSYFDSLAATIIGLMIVKMGLQYGWNAIKELVDTAVDKETFQTIQKLILEVHGVVKIHQLRSRFMGRDIFIDVHIQVSPFISVSEGHYIAQKVHNYLVQKIEHVEDVIVHVDPEDDETFSPSLLLPDRQLIAGYFTAYSFIETVEIHYLQGQIQLDLLLKEKISQKDLTGLAQEITNLRLLFPCIHQVCVLSSVAVY